MKKSFKRALTLVLAGAMIFGVTDYSTISAAKTKKKSTKTSAKVTLKLSKTKATLNEGKKLTLKIKKKNVKKIKSQKWSTSKKSVATVSKKGVVTAKKAGKATITCTVKYTVKGVKKAKSKKIKCKVTVKATYSIKSVEVVNPFQIRVTLNQKYALAQSDFAVKTKEDGGGSYNKTLVVGSVANSGQKVYDLTLADLRENDPDAEYNAVFSGEYVQVTIKKLNGTKTGETTYVSSAAADNTYLQGMVGKYFTNRVSLSSGLTSTGYCTGVQVNGTLPAGITAKVNASSGVVRFTGTPTAVANGAKVTITGKDEKGRALTQNVLFYIGSKDVLVTYTETEHKTFLVNDNKSKSFYAHTVGGSGSYTYTWTPVTNSLIDLSGSSVYISAYTESNNIKAYLPAGAYNFAYTVADSSNENIKATGSINTVAIAGTEVVGKITTADGTVLEDAYFSASFNDKNHQYYRSEDGVSAYTDEKGEFATALIPSQVYQVSGEKGNATKNYYNQTIGTTKLTYNFALPLYKVTVAMPADVTLDDEDGVRVLDDDQSTVGYVSSSKNFIYLIPGYYRFEAYASSKTGDWWNGYKRTYATYNAETVLGTAAQTVTLALDPKTVSENNYAYGAAKEVYRSIYADAEESFSLSEAYDDYDAYALRFTPSESGDYILSGEVFLYDPSKNTAAEAKIADYKTVDGGKQYTLSADQEYIVANEGQNASGITIKKVKTEDTPAE